VSKLNEKKSITPAGEVLQNGKVSGKVSRSKKKTPVQGREDHSEKDSLSSLLEILKGVGPLSSNYAQLRNQLRSKIEKYLIKDFEIPELIEGLVEFLLEMVQQDPATQASLEMSK
jgi:hypothetical protein